MVERLLGSVALAGLGTSLLYLARMLVAYPIGWLMDTYGRKAGLLLGLMLSLLGAVVVGLSIVATTDHLADNHAVLKIGHIVGLQVQRSALKLPSPPGMANGRYYDPGALMQVGRLKLTSEGVLGVVEAGEPVIDVHHQHHPTSKNVDGENGMSVGFTSHYARMRERFGPHLVDGIAGENVLVAVDDQIALERLLGGLDIELRDGRRVHLERIVVAEPCIEFTRYALRLDPVQPGGEAATAGLQFLRNGMRGFYVSYLGEPAMLSVGDGVFAPS